MTAPESGSHESRLAEEATTWFVRINSDSASDTELRAFHDWLERDPAHAAAYAEAEALWSELGQVPDPRQNLETAARSEQPPVRKRRSFGLKTVVTLAACLVLAFGALWKTGTYDRLRADHATAVGETREIRLPDGTVLELNTDSALALGFTADRRRVRLLRGEAFFTVAKDPQRPFEVIGDGLIAQALATAFVMRSTAGAEVVAVSEGRVRVSSRSAQAQPNQSVVVAAGEAAGYLGSAELTKQPAEVLNLTSWREGKLVFAGRPLRAVIEELDRYRPGIIVILDSAVAEARFTGVLTLQDSERALKAIEGTLPVEAIRLSRYLTLLRSRS